MILTKSYIRHLRTEGRLTIPQELEEILLDRLGVEPAPYSYSEQDLAEQTRKLINRYETARGRLELLYRVDQLREELQALDDQISRELEADDENTDITF